MSSYQSIVKAHSSINEETMGSKAPQPAPNQEVADILSEYRRNKYLAYLQAIEDQLSLIPVKYRDFVKANLSLDYAKKRKTVLDIEGFCLIHYDLYSPNPGYINPEYHWSVKKFFRPRKYFKELGAALEYAKRYNG